MAKDKRKKEDFYFNNFCEAAQISLTTAELLKGALSEFRADTLDQKREELHEWENRGDKKKHEMMAELVRAFITPIEREDILALSQNIDEVTDNLDDIMMQFYVNAIDAPRPEALEFADLLVRSCRAMCEMLEEFKNFKKSKVLNEYLMKINDLEEEGDRIFVSAIRRLSVEEKDPMVVIAWREIFGYFEKTCDAVEHVADIVESIVIGNS